MNSLQNLRSVLFVLGGVLILGVHCDNPISISQTQSQITVKVGDTTDLKCEAPVDYNVKGCQFENKDTGVKYFLYDGAAYEDNRIQNSKVSDRDCGMNIANVLEKDNGRWECFVAAVSEVDGTSQSGSGIVDLTVAVAPKEINLYVDDQLSVNDRLEIKLDEDSGMKKIKCEAIGARPKPDFKWMIGDTVVNGEKTDEETDGSYSQTLTYYPDNKHNGLKLACHLDHIGYTMSQKEEGINVKSLNVELLYKPKEKAKVDEIYIPEVGSTKEVRIKFEAYPKPTQVQWIIEGLEEPLNNGDTALNGKYVADPELKNGDISGEFLAILTISSVEKEDIGKVNKLMVTNDEGETAYEFKLLQGDQPPADGNNPVVARTGDSEQGEPMNSGPVIGVIIVVIIIIVLIGAALVARSKGLLCFADNKSKSEDTEAAVEKEGSDTESAEHAEETKETKEGNKKCQKSSVKNIFAAMKKSVSKKDKYSSSEPNESELKVALQDGEEKKDLEKDDVTYANLDKTALSTSGNRTTLTNEDEKTEYAEIQHPKKDDN